VPSIGKVVDYAQIKAHGARAAAELIENAR
jgi:hypothetical protein